MNLQLDIDDLRSIEISEKEINDLIAQSEQLRNGLSSNPELYPFIGCITDKSLHFLITSLIDKVIRQREEIKLITKKLDEQ